MAPVGSQGLSVLRNRGYDSAGMATTAPEGLTISKYASRGESGAPAPAKIQKSESVIG